MKKLTMLMMLLILPIFAHASNVKPNQQRYQTLVDISSISSCLSKNWKYKGETWYGATYIYTEVNLVKKWLEDSSGNLIAGSLESIVDKQGRIVSTEDVHSSERSALNECFQRLKLKEAGAVSKQEVTDAIERFLKN